ncbi:MAG: hypothetical protein NZL92_09105, partial [Gloeomargarita sp. SKYG116]|nr:hypothetical protein [Gloeomargarita sp. SKYG116]MDW8401839.1 hypothetical protein [Gloeomargarita sp. SKYGB_i_bin116]
MPLRALAQITHAKPTSGTNLGNPYNQYLPPPPVTPPIPKDSGNTTNTMPTVPSHLQQQLFNRDRDEQRGITGTLPNQERLLQIDPRLLPPLPEGARHAAEAQSIQEAAQGMKDSA